MSANTQVAIVGGGAAGLVAAIAAAREGASVTVLEAGPRIGAPILKTGNGRCNFTNTGIDGISGHLPYRNPEFVRSIIERYACIQILQLFVEMGLVASTDDPEGRVYPCTYSAATVVDVLRYELDHLGVEQLVDFKAVDISKKGTGIGCFTITAEDGRSIRANSVVVTTGGGESLLSSMGHDMIPCQPALCALSTDTKPLKGLDGVRARCRVSLWDDVRSDRFPVMIEDGEVLFRNYGISGIVTFDISRHARPGQQVVIDFVPKESYKQLKDHFARRYQQVGWRTAVQFTAGLLHRKIAEAVLRSINIPFDTPMSEVDLNKLAGGIKRFTLNVTGFANVDHAQVTRGGADVSQFDPETMASLVVDGLFAAGEVLDVDAPCGGYNLHWAWASGLVAGESAAHSSQKTETRGQR